MMDLYMIQACVVYKIKPPRQHYRWILKVLIFIQYSSFMFSDMSYAKTNRYHKQAIFNSSGLIYALLNKMIVILGLNN